MRWRFRESSTACGRQAAPPGGGPRPTKSSQLWSHTSTRGSPPSTWPTYVSCAESLRLFPSESAGTRSTHSLLPWLHTVICKLLRAAPPVLKDAVAVSLLEAAWDAVIAAMVNTPMFAGRRELRLQGCAFTPGVAAIVPLSEDEGITVVAATAARLNAGLITSCLACHL